MWVFFQSSLQELDYDLSLIGFSQDELDVLFEDQEEGGGLTEDDAIPDVPIDPVSKLGDLWILGNHRLLCGDATLAADVQTLMAGQLADMAFTDPPYNVNYGNSARFRYRQT